jgi:ATP-dependent protease ClpP protease subunit
MWPPSAWVSAPAWVPCCVLIHQGSGGFSGAVPDIEVAAREALTLSAKCIAILAAHSGQPYEKVKRDSDRDYYMSAQEAKEYGLIDEVLESGPAASSAMGQPESELETNGQRLSTISRT